MIADLLSKLEDDEKERQAKFQKLAPMVDQFSSPDRAAATRPLGQGRTERALLDLARSKPGGAATLERGTQQAQTPAIKQALARLAPPASGNRRVPQKGRNVTKTI